MPWTILIFNKSKRYQRPDIKDNGQKYQFVRSYNVSKTSISYRYQLKRLFDVFVGQSHLDTTWYSASTSQIGLFYLSTSETSEKRLK